MKKIILTTLLISTLTIQSCGHIYIEQRAPSSFEETELTSKYQIPDLITDEGRISLLMTVNKEIPNIIDDAQKLKINLFEILDVQEKSQKELFSLPGYKDEMNKFHSTKLEIKVSPKKEEFVTTYEIDKRNIENLKWNIRQVYSSYKTTENVKKKLESNLKLLNNRSSVGVINGLAVTLENDKRTEFYKLKDTKSKIEYLSKHLPLNVSNKFKRELHGLNLIDNRNEIIKKIKDIQKLEDEIVGLLQIVLLQKEVIGEFNSSILKLSNDQIVLFSSNAALNLRYELLKKDDLRNSSKYLNKHIYSLVLDNFRSYTNAIKEVKKSITNGLIIKEVPPVMALFRGYVGGDCATSRSLSMPNVPTEKVFFIYDETHSLKGYLSGYIGLVEERPVFKIMSLNGVRLSGNDAKVVLEALEEAKFELGVTSIVLPNSERMNVLVNYDEIKLALMKPILDGQSVEVNYLDKDIRQLLKSLNQKFNDSNYDDVELNTEGRIYKKNNFALDISTRKFSPYFRKNMDAVSLKLAYVLKNQQKLSESFIKEWLLSIGKEDLFNDINETKQSISSLVNKLRSELNLFEISERQLVLEYFDIFIKNEHFSDYLKKQDKIFFEKFSQFQVQKMFNVIKEPEFSYVKHLFSSDYAHIKNSTLSYLINKLDQKEIRDFASQYLRVLDDTSLSILLAITNSKLEDKFIRDNFIYLLSKKINSIDKILQERIAVIDNDKLVSDIIHSKNEQMIGQLITSKLSKDFRLVNSKNINAILDVENINLNNKLISFIFIRDESLIYVSEFNRLISNTKFNYNLEDLIKSKIYITQVDSDKIILEKIDSEIVRLKANQAVKNLFRTLLMNQKIIENKKLVLGIVRKYDVNAIESIMDSEIFRNKEIFDLKFIKDFFKEVKNNKNRSELFNQISIKILDKYKQIDVRFAIEFLDQINSFELSNFLNHYSKLIPRNSIDEQFEFTKKLVEKYSNEIRNNKQNQLNVSIILKRFSSSHSQEVEKLSQLITIKPIKSLIPIEEGSCINLIKPFIR